MDFTLIWFPLLKTAVTLGLLYGAYYFLSRKKNKVGAWYIGLLIFFWILTPYRYDGTNSVDRSVATQEMRTQEYAIIVEDNAPVYKELPSFEERMRIQEEYSQRANKVVTDEIVK